MQLDLETFALAVNSKPFNVFHYRTTHSVKDLLKPAYFMEAIESLIRKGDRIEVFANADGKPEFATVAVTNVVRSGEAKCVEVTKL
ncbi:hypothetical protein [Bradyrhizobium genomosp. III]|uniref:hypothetical protein n=1 Tax=Bradyrhizobium genomosp. III TaxID=2683271 RepID=UPI0004ACE883|nr:hypothetical protein [Bradyrhizobium sp. CCBAU 15544]